MSLYIPPGYSQNNKFFQDFSLAEHHEKDPDNITIIIIIDGLSDKFFREQIAKAPNLYHLLTTGAYYLKNTTCLPSCTGIGHAHILTGVNADKHHICGLNFLNKQNHTHFNGLATNIETLLNAGLSNEIKTIFENNTKVKSASIWNPVTRGADITFPYYKTWYRHAAQMAISQIKSGARIITIWYPLLDPIGHYLGNEHSFRKFWWHRIDYQIGILYRWLMQEKYLEKSMIYITSDHGQTKVNQKLDLYKYFRNMGYTTLGKDHISIAGEISSSDYDIFICRNGYRFAHLYFGNKISSEEILKIKKLLLSEKAVRNVFTKVGNMIVVESRFGRGIICVTNEQIPKYSYKVVQGEDPLMYDDITLYNRNLSEDAWKGLTMYSESPGVVPQIFQLMSSENAGDITVAANAGYHFSAIPHKAAHGGLESEELIVPTITLFPEYTNKRNEIECMSLKKELK